MRVVAIASGHDRSRPAKALELPPFDPTQIRHHRADEHLCALGNDGRVRAHCSLWWKEVATLPGHRAGAIGHYASTDDDAAAELLDAAAARLRENGCTLAIGPMDGNTWRRYRFVTGEGEIHLPELPFFLEPANQPHWPLQFEHAAFRKVAEYYSALNSDLSSKDKRIEPVAARLETAGVRIRSAVDMEMRAQLPRIYQLSRIAFARNFLYTEMPEEDFVAQYNGLLDRIRPELLLLAERDGELVGYLFAIPDFAQAARSCAIDTFLIKTVAILPHSDLRGLGGVLVGRAQQAGHRLGYRRCIHALMHEDNASRNISSHYAQITRRYTLYSRELAG